MQHLVKQLMSTELITLEEDQDLGVANLLMSLAHVRHLPVVRGDELVGLVTHRDLLKAQASALEELSSEERRERDQRIRASDVMRREVRTVTPGTPVIAAARILREHKFGCLPVVDDGQLVGIVTEADFLDVVIRALEKESSPE
jgi:CBS domain-containing membrane protein